MADARAEALLRYLRELRDLMRLQAWDLELHDKPADSDESILEIHTQVRRHCARVAIGSFFDEDPLEQRQAAVHEVVHLIQADLNDYIHEEGWHSRIGPDVSGAIVDRIHLELEIHADLIARVIAPSMPMPPEWPGDA